MQMTWTNCVRVLVFIAESALRRLPDADMTSHLGACIMHGFFNAFCPRMLLLYNDFVVGKKVNFHPLKYANAVACCNDRVNVTNPNNDNVPEDVVDAVRAMFLRDMICVDNVEDTHSPSLSSCRYGDWLLETNQPISPYDYLLWRHDFNYSPEYENGILHGALDEVSGFYNVDVNNTAASAPGFLKCQPMYDFMLLNLIRAWRRPWSIDSHHSFQPAFRQACTTLALCANRVCRCVLNINIPLEVVQMILPFLHRDWWPDDGRKQCFSQSCLLSSISTKLEQKIIARNGNNSASNRPLQHVHTACIYKRYNACKSGCTVERYCSKECAKDAWKEGHKRMCRYAPYRFGRGEEALCRQVIDSDGTHIEDNDACIGLATATWGSKSNSTSNAVDVYEYGSDDGDDDSSWESVASDEEDLILTKPVKKSKAEIVFEYFEQKSYRHQRTEPLPFAGFYVDDE